MVAGGSRNLLESNVNANSESLFGLMLREAGDLDQSFTCF